MSVTSTRSQTSSVPPYWLAESDWKLGDSFIDKPPTSAEDISQRMAAIYAAHAALQASSNPHLTK